MSHHLNVDAAVMLSSIFELDQLEELSLTLDGTCHFGFSFCSLIGFERLQNLTYLSIEYICYCWEIDEISFHKLKPMLSLRYLELKNYCVNEHRKGNKLSTNEDGIEMLNGIALTCPKLEHLRLFFHCLPLNMVRQHLSMFKQLQVFEIQLPMHPPTEKYELAKEFPHLQIKLVKDHEYV